MPGLRIVLSAAFVQVSPSGEVAIPIRWPVCHGSSPPTPWTTSVESVLLGASHSRRRCRNRGGLRCVPCPHEAGAVSRAAGPGPDELVLVDWRTLEITNAR